MDDKEKRIIDFVKKFDFTMVMSHSHHMDGTTTVNITTPIGDPLNLALTVNIDTLEFEIFHCPKYTTLKLTTGLCGSLFYDGHFEKMYGMIAGYVGRTL